MGESRPLGAKPFWRSIVGMAGLDMSVEYEILIDCSADDWKQRTEAWEIDVDGGK